jgi:hypothetical protein
MPLKSAALAFAFVTLVPAAACAADYVTITQDVTVNAPADVAWPRIDGFCQIGAWFKTTCVLTSGQDGDIGAVRRVADRLDELLVARTPTSYAYSQPKSPIDYHGSVEIRPVDAGRARLIYTLVYDADALPKHTPDDKAADRESRTKQLAFLVGAMKAAAEIN